VSRRALRSRRPPEELDLRTLVAAEVVCLLTWVLTGGEMALFPAVVAGLGLILVAVSEENDSPQRRRVR
jgi:hypothetical protein